MIHLLPMPIMQALARAAPMPRLEMCEASVKAACPFVSTWPLDDVALDMPMATVMMYHQHTYQHMCPSEDFGAVEWVRLVFENGVPVMVAIWVMMILAIFGSNRV